MARTTNLFPHQGQLDTGAPDPGRHQRVHPNIAVSARLVYVVVGNIGHQLIPHRIVLRDAEPPGRNLYGFVA